MTDDVILVPLNKLRPPKNIHSMYSSTAEKENDLRDLLLTMKQDGVYSPLRISKDYQILDGRKRYLAAKILELSQLPCSMVKFPDLVFVRESTWKRTALYVDGKLYKTGVSVPDVLQCLSDERIIVSQTRVIDDRQLDSTRQFPSDLEDLTLRGAKSTGEKFAIGRKT
ncbi:ParB/RepB/Spo0J family partition protein [Candidatus Pacearchaeota archaeon]|jgi:hypothetical protein|nr:ParB/RepB/Spo0J family partition protein [Candidatus Pacearchaeota archaeon]